MFPEPSLDCAPLTSRLSRYSLCDWSEKVSRSLIIISDSDFCECTHAYIFNNFLRKQTVQDDKESFEICFSAPQQQQKLHRENLCKQQMMCWRKGNFYYIGKELRNKVFSFWESMQKKRSREGSYHLFISTYNFLRVVEINVSVSCSLLFEKVARKKLLKF